MRLRFPPLVLVLIALLASPGLADARPRSKPEATLWAGLWASINKCDTRAAPNTVGVRGSMPGLGGRRLTAWMRLQVEYRGAGGSWVSAGSSADSNWKRLSSGTTDLVESGHDFKFEAPKPGSRHVFRGVVKFRWTNRKGKTVRTATRVTEAGHRASAGADPSGYSAATCVLR